MSIDQAQSLSNEHHSSSRLDEEVRISTPSMFRFELLPSLSNTQTNRTKIFVKTRRWMIVKARLCIIHAYLLVIYIYIWYHSFVMSSSRFLRPFEFFRLSEADVMIKLSYVIHKMIYNQITEINALRLLRCWWADSNSLAYYIRRSDMEFVNCSIDGKFPGAVYDGSYCDPMGGWTRESGGKSSPHVSSWRLLNIVSLYILVLVHPSRARTVFSSCSPSKRFRSTSHCDVQLSVVAAAAAAAADAAARMPPCRTIIWVNGASCRFCYARATVIGRSMQAAVTIGGDGCLSSFLIARLVRW